MTGKIRKLLFSLVGVALCSHNVAGGKSTRSSYDSDSYEPDCDAWDGISSSEVGDDREFEGYVLLLGRGRSLEVSNDDIDKLEDEMLDLYNDLADCDSSESKGLEHEAVDVDVIPDVFGLLELDNDSNDDDDYYYHHRSLHERKLSLLTNPGEYFDELKRRSVREITARDELRAQNEDSRRRLDDTDDYDEDLRYLTRFTFDTNGYTSDDIFEDDRRRRKLQKIQNLLNERKLTDYEQGIFPEEPCECDLPESDDYADDLDDRVDDIDPIESVEATIALPIEETDCEGDPDEFGDIGVIVEVTGCAADLLDSNNDLELVEISLGLAYNEANILNGKQCDPFARRIVDVHAESITVYDVRRRQMLESLVEGPQEEGNPNKFPIRRSEQGSQTRRSFDQFPMLDSELGGNEQRKLYKSKSKSRHDNSLCDEPHGFTLEFRVELECFGCEGNLIHVDEPEEEGTDDEEPAAEEDDGESSRRRHLRSLHEDLFYHFCYCPEDVPLKGLDIPDFADAWDDKLTVLHEEYDIDLNLDDFAVEVFDEDKEADVTDQATDPPVVEPTEARPPPTDPPEPEPTSPSGPPPTSPPGPPPTNPPGPPPTEPPEEEPTDPPTAGSAGEVVPTASPTASPTPAPTETPPTPSPTTSPPTPAPTVAPTVTPGSYIVIFFVFILFRIIDIDLVFFFYPSLAFLLPLLLKATPPGLRLHLLQPNPQLSRHPLPPQPPHLHRLLHLLSE